MPENAAPVRHLTRGCESGGYMKKEYDFSNGRRGALIPQTGKTRITIYIEDRCRDAAQDPARGDCSSPLDGGAGWPGG